MHDQQSRDEQPRDSDSGPADRTTTHRVSQLPLLLAGVLGVLVIGTIVGLIVAIALSDDGDSTAVAVRDFSEILADDFTIDPDPSGTSAVLRLETTIDVACSVAFGPTTDFGGLATDTDMAGGGHAVHSPVLTGLEPGTTIHWKVQGAAADGTLYVSDVMEFTTPTGEDAATRPNLSLDATVADVSSEFGPGFAAGNAIDGDRGTEWSSAGDGDDAFIVVDLGASREITGVGFRTREMSDGTAVTESFTVTIDGDEVFGPFDAGPGVAVADLTSTGREVRIDMEETTGGNTGAVEIEVFGP